MRSILIYDCEISKAIQGRKDERINGIEYCDGWRDFAGMGVSVVCAYDYLEDRFRVFLQDNLPEFHALTIDRDVIVGFNNLAFDNQLMAAHRINIPTEKSYDILVEIWAAAGLEPTFNYRTHGGYGLEAMCEANFGAKKVGNGALAPVDWQRGYRGGVIDYCLNDVRLTKMLLDTIEAGSRLTNPKNMDAPLEMKTIGERIN